MPDDDDFRAPLAAVAATGAAPVERLVGPFRLRERPLGALASVAARGGRGDAVAARLAQIVGGAPGVAGRARAAPYETLWIGPDQWFVMADEGGEEKLAHTLAEALGGAASVTEQNDGWVCFELEGPGLDAALERLVNRDLAALGPGAVARAAIEHVACHVCVDAPDARCRVLGPRSTALSLLHALETALASVAALRGVR